MMTKSDPGTVFLDAVLRGRRHTEAEWLAYFERFHGDNPTANDMFTLLVTQDGKTSYGLLASAAAAAGGTAILDVGCGDGNLTDELLAALPPDARLAGVDICEAEIALAQRRFEGEPRVSFVRADACALPYEDERFDLVLSHQFLNFLPNPMPVLLEAARVLRPGGTLLFAVNRGWKLDRENNWVRMYEAACAALRETYPEFYPPLMEDPRIYSTSGIREMLEQTERFVMQTLSIEIATPRALMTPERVAEIYNRMYVFASIPEKRAVLRAVHKRATELSRGGLTEIEIPFRLVSAQRKRRRFLSVVK